MYRFIIAILCCITILEGKLVQAQERMHYPLDSELLLSGNFGEIRTNHFHGGLDFKTGGRIGLPVFALCDGYISSISVTEGSGYVLELVCDNGYSAIYRHLSNFMPAMTRKIKELQYQKESYQVKISPSVDEYRVKKGEQIGWSGNTGFSFGPHLHLDMFDTFTGDFIDPIPFFKEGIKDHIAPRVKGYMVSTKPGEGVLNGKTGVQTFIHQNKISLEAWGKIGLGIHAYDYMDNTSNKYGVHTVILKVDGSKVFKSEVTHFSREENRMINSWTYGPFMKSFIEPGNRLRMLKAYNDDNGFITINEERPYHIEYILQDALGNKSTYAFVIKGKKQAIPPSIIDEKYGMSWNKINYLQAPGLELFVPKGRLYDDVVLEFAQWIDSCYVSDVYQLNKTRIALHQPATLVISLKRTPVADVSKYFMAKITPRGPLIVNGEYDNGRMKSDILDLGVYAVAIDTVAPLVTPIAKNSWRNKGKIVFSVRDKLSGIRSCKGSLDGKFVIFGRPNLTSTRYVCKLDPSRIAKGKRHQLILKVLDGCGNETIVKEEFVW